MTIESTTKIVTLNGVPARVWEGTTEAGVPVVAFVTRVGCRDQDDAAEFHRDLHACKVPSVDVSMLPASMSIGSGLDLLD